MLNYFNKNHLGLNNKLFGHVHLISYVILRNMITEYTSSRRSYKPHSNLVCPKHVIHERMDSVTIWPTILKSYNEDCTVHIKKILETLSLFLKGLCSLLNEQNNAYSPNSLENLFTIMWTMLEKYFWQLHLIWNTISSYLQKQPSWLVNIIHWI